jgi:1,4-alpha-glucan branching enzyme
MATTSSRPGMGAIPFPGGTSFRVWAPFANRVFVAGDFNGWSDSTTEMAAEGNGYWSTDLMGANPGHRYRFVLDGRWKIDPQARDVTNSVGDGVIVSREYPWTSNLYAMPPWNELVIYEMHAATFPDKLVQKGMLLDSIGRDMPYLRDLGVNAIQLMPMHEFPGDDSWGYNPSHIFAIEDSYGGPDALKRLIDTAHFHGIAVILDVVYNHLGPTDLDLWQFDGWRKQWNGEDMGGIYFYNDWRAWTPWGTKNRPDFGRPEVRSYIRDNALMWLEEYHLDGLRFDMTVYIRNVYGREDAIGDPANLHGWGWNLMRWINDEINYRQPWKITIAEDMRQNPAMTRPTSTGGAGFDSQWDDQFHHRVRDVVVTANDGDRDMEVIKQAIERKYNGSGLQRLIFTESHDEVNAQQNRKRLPEEIHPGNADSRYAQSRSTLAAVLMLTSPGIPMLFQGQEILESIPFADNVRIDWDKYDRFRGIWNLYRDAIRLRRNWFNNTRGLKGDNVNVFHVNNADKLVAFHRWDQGGPGDDVVVALNFADRGYAKYEIGFPREGLWRTRFNSNWSGYSDKFSNWYSYDASAVYGPRDNLPCRANIAIGPYSAIILSQ